MEGTSKVKPNKSDRLRKGRKFRKNNKRKEKKISRPFPFRIPRTSFSCRDRAPGYYADMEADCQVRCCAINCVIRFLSGNKIDHIWPKQ